MEEACIYCLFQPPQPEEIADLIYLSKICWNEITAIPWGEEEFLADFQGKWQVSQIAKNQGGEIIGCAIGHISKLPHGPPLPPQGKVALLNKLAVLPDYRGSQAMVRQRKVGTALVESFCLAASYHGLKTVRLSVHEQNIRAINLYLALGFTQVEKKDYVDLKLLIMDRDIDGRNQKP